MSGKVTYRQQFTRCGKQRCHICRQGPGHGPYWYAYWSVNGHTFSKYLGKDAPKGVQIEIKTRERQQARGAGDDDGSHASPPAPQRNAQKEVPVDASQPARKSISSSMENFSDNQPLLRIYLLGQFRIERRIGKDWQALASPLWQRRRTRALLGCLLSNPGRRMNREEAMNALWPDLGIETAANRINGAVHEVRRLLEPEMTQTAASRMLRLERGVLQLAGADLIWVDADSFEYLHKTADATFDPVQAEHLLEEAARLYGGDYLLEELYAGWATMRRESLRRGWIDALLKLAELRSSRGALSSAIEALDRLLASDPAHETAVRRMMLLLTRLDRRGEALQVYHRLVSNLEREYESDPLPETHELYEALLKGYQGISSAELPGTIPNQASSDTGEMQQQFHVSHDSELQHRLGRAFPRPVFWLERQHRNPLVGRDQELMIMRGHLFAAGDASREEAHEGRTGQSEPIDKPAAGNLLRKQKQPQFVLLMGEAGIGKTRLAGEFSQEAYAQGWTIAWGHAREEERAKPFRPWIEALRTLLQEDTLAYLISSGETSSINESDELSSTSQHASRLKAALAQLSACLPGLVAYDTPAVAHKATITPMSPAQERLRLWEAALTLLSALSRETRLLLVLDDLHRADESSLELLAYVLRHLRDEPVLLVGTCRDEELTTNAHLRTLINDLRREQRIAALSLQPLTYSQIGTLVAHLPEGIAHHIQVLAGGNPFFAEELVRASETSRASVEGSTGEMGSASQFHISNTEVPAGMKSDGALSKTIASILERRLSKLSKDCLALLDKASALGDAFELNQLLQAGDRGPPEDTALDLLDEALRAGFLIEERTAAGITYRFRGPVYLHPGK